MADFSDMVSEWPRRRAQTQSALKKERPLEDKILASIEKKVSHIQEMLEPAAENSSLSRKVAKEAAETADAVAKVRIGGTSVHAAFLEMFLMVPFPLQESKDVLTQAKHARTASAHLGSHIDSALQQLVEQEALTGAADFQITEVLVRTTEPRPTEPHFLCVVTVTSCFSARGLPGRRKGGHGSRQARASGLC